MKKTIFLLLLMPVLLYAEPISPNQAQQVAQNFINSIAENYSASANNRAPRKQRALVQQRMQSLNNSPLYIFNSNDGEGFVIVSGDDCATPILGYSDEGFIDPENLPIQLIDLLQSYSDEIQYARDNNLQASDSVRNMWSTIQNAPQSTNTSAAVSALVSTKWNQSPYYNAKCPNDATLSPLGGHPTTGCVATAMAQIMKYWGYPSNGSGSKSYKSQNYGTLSANFAITTYDWANMPIKLSSSSSSAQVNAVSTLMYHCGVGVEMNYNCDGNGSSGAYTVDVGGGRASAENALRQYFGYSSSVTGKKWTTTTSETTWKNMLKTELNNNRPVLYSGRSSSSGGHAFVCDGYDSNDRFHFNWGWGGSADGYFSLTALTPSSYNFSEGQQAIIGIKPADGSAPAKAYDLYMNTDLTTNSSSYTFGNAMSFSAKVENNGTGVFNGSFKVAIFTNSGEFMAWSKESYHFSLAAGQNTILKTYTFDGGIPFVPGSYRAYMYFQDDNETDCKLVKTDEGVFLTEYNNIGFSITSSSDLQPVSAYTVYDEPLDYFIVGQRARINVNVRNSALFTTFYGKIRLCLYDSNGSRAQIIEELDFSNGFSSNSTLNLQFYNFIEVDPGTYYLALTYQKSNQSTWYYMGCGSTYLNPTKIIVKAPALVSDDYESNNTQTSATSLIWSIDEEVEDFGTLQVSLHSETDVDYYKLSFPESNKYKIDIRLYDKYNQGGWWYENADAQFAYSIGGGTYSDYYSASKSISFNGPTTLYIRVIPQGLQGLGYYELAGDITESIRDAIENISAEQSSSKVLQDGHIYIVRDNKMYTLTGQIVK